MLKNVKKRKSRKMSRKNNDIQMDKQRINVNDKQTLTRFVPLFSKSSVNSPSFF